MLKAPLLTVAPVLSRVVPSSHLGTTFVPLFQPEPVAVSEPPG